MGGVASARGTSNADCRGSAAARRRRKEYLLEVYAADERLWVVRWRDEDTPDEYFSEATARAIEQVMAQQYGTSPVLGVAEVPTCRCYRCGELLVYETLTVDRIVPGCFGGTYVRVNIRPACGDCNEATGGRLARWFEAAHKKALHRRRVRDRARRQAARAAAAGRSQVVALAVEGAPPRGPGEQREEV